MENFYQIIRVTEYGYIINLDCFLGGEAFNVRLLEFLDDFTKKRYNLNSGCDIYLLEFNNIILSSEPYHDDFREIIYEDRIEIPFLYPYVDKGLSFNHLYELYLYVYNTNSIYLYIHCK